MIPTIGLPAEAMRLAQLLHDYDETLELRWIPPEVRTGFDGAPFAVWQINAGVPDYQIMALKQNELDHRVIEAIWNANVNENDIMKRLENQEDARRAWELSEELARREEKEDFIKWAIKDVGHDRFHKGRRYT